MKNRTKAPEENRWAIRWVEDVGIMEVSDPNGAVTRGELAEILHRTLEYFFTRLIEALEKR